MWFMFNTGDTVWNENISLYVRCLLRKSISKYVAERDYQFSQQVDQESAYLVLGY